MKTLITVFLLLSLSGTISAEEGDDREWDSEKEPFVRVPKPPQPPWKNSRTDWENQVNPPPIQQRQEIERRQLNETRRGTPYERDESWKENFHFPNEKEEKAANDPDPIGPPPMGQESWEKWREYREVLREDAKRAPAGSGFLINPVNQAVEIVEDPSGDLPKRLPSNFDVEIDPKTGESKFVPINYLGRAEDVPWKPRMKTVYNERTGTFEKVPYEPESVRLARTNENTKQVYDKRTGEFVRVPNEKYDAYRREVEEAVAKGNVFKDDPEKREAFIGYSINRLAQDRYDFSDSYNDEITDEPTVGDAIAEGLRVFANTYEETSQYLNATPDPNQGKWWYAGDDHYGAGYYDPNWVISRRNALTKERQRQFQERLDSNSPGSQASRLPPYWEHPHWDSKRWLSEGDSYFLWFKKKYGYGP